MTVRHRHLHCRFAAPPRRQEQRSDSTTRTATSSADEGSRFEVCASRLDLPPSGPRRRRPRARASLLLHNRRGAPDADRVRAACSTGGAGAWTGARAIRSLSSSYDERRLSFAGGEAYPRRRGRRRRLSRGRRLKRHRGQRRGGAGCAAAGGGGGTDAVALATDGKQTGMLVLGRGVPAKDFHPHLAEAPRRREVAGVKRYTLSYLGSCVEATKVEVRRPGAVPKRRY